MHFFSQKHRIVELGVIALIFVSALLLRVYDLNWGAPFYFHPDERNIAAAVSQLSFPTQLNPHFFAYGSVTLYVIFFLGLLWANLSSLVHHTVLVSSITFEHAIVISRILSAMYSLATLILLYITAKKIMSQKLATTVLLLATYSIGFIQFAHFGTVESTLTFYYLILFSLLRSYIKTGKKRTLVWACVVASVAVAIKISSAILLPVVLLVVLYRQKHHLRFLSLWTIIHVVRAFIGYGVLLTLITVLIFILTSPYALLDLQSFLGSITYESNVATGVLPVFYTGDFFDRTPLFPWIHVYPFILNPVVMLLFVPCFIGLLIFTLRNKEPSVGLILVFFILLLNAQTALFTKWTRYFIPSLPYMYLLIGVACYKLSLRYRYARIRTQLLSGILNGAVILSALWALAFIITVYVEPDPRVAAADYARTIVPTNAPITSEVYDLGIVPFNPYFPHITLVNFYDMDNNNPTQVAVAREQLQLSEYLVLPSQRIVDSRLNHPKRFPNGYRLYHKLFTNQLEFKKIYQTPCSIFCKIVYLNNPVNAFEQTATVFDRPTVFIFKKIH